MGTNSADTYQDDGRLTPDSPFFNLIQEAYKVFKRPTPRDDGACDCCMAHEIKRDFFKHGQRDMPLHYLQEWYIAAVEPAFFKDVWAYLLPRIMEALASGAEISSVGIEVVLHRFPTGVKGNWTKKEWNVLDRFQRLYLTERRPNECDNLDAIICMFAKAGWDIDDLFNQLVGWPTEQLVDRLWQDWCASTRIYHDIPITLFWDDSSIPRRYYTNEALQDRMITFGLDDANDPVIATRALEVADIMRTHQHN